MLPSLLHTCVTRHASGCVILADASSRNKTLFFFLALRHQTQIWVTSDGNKSLYADKYAQAGQCRPQKSHNVVQFSQQQSVILPLEDKCVINYPECDGEVKRRAEQEVWCLIHHVHSPALQMKCFGTTNCDSVAFQLCLKVPSPARAPCRHINIRPAFLKNNDTFSLRTSNVSKLEKHERRQSHRRLVAPFQAFQIFHVEDTLQENVKYQ